jgi:hypothetical protein
LDDLALRHWFSSDENSKGELILIYEEKIKLAISDGLTEPEYYGKFCNNIKDRLNDLDSEVSPDNIVDIIPSYMNLLLENQVIKFLIRGITKKNMHTQVTNPLTPEFLNVIKKMENFIENSSKQNIDFQIAYKAIWRLLEVNESELSLKYGNILINFFDKIEKLYSIDRHFLKNCYIHRKFFTTENEIIPYTIYKNQQSSRIMLATIGKIRSEINISIKAYKEICNNFNKDDIYGNTKIPHRTANNRILESAIELSKIDNSFTKDDVLEIFFKMNSKGRMHNMESTYESLLILYMLKNRFFEND